MNLNEIKNAIINWKQIKNTERAYEILLKTNNIFISNDQYDNWVKPIDKCFLYLGEVDDKVKFYLCNDYIQNVLSTRQIIECNTLNKMIKLEIQPKEAHIRMQKWDFNNSEWFERVKQELEVVEYFEVPISDFTKLFENSAKEIILNYALKLFIGRRFEDIEIIFSTNVDENREYYADLTRPCPPFGKP